MKQIIATIRPVMLDAVVCALHKLQDFPGATICKVENIGKGFHQSDGSTRKGDGLSNPEFIRLEVICRDELCDGICQTIVRHGNTGKPEDGHIATATIDSASAISNLST